jgi:predicted metalloendopeptidase
LSADTRLRELINKLKSRVEAEVTEKRETARLYQSELDLETLEGERVERVKELMRSRMQDVEKQLSEFRPSQERT